MRLLITIFALTLLPTIVLGQQRTIKGRLVSVDDRTPIPGWNVLEPGTKNGTVTDVNGEFTLTLNSQPTIIWFPQCFTQLYVEYEENIDFKEIVLGTDIRDQIYKDSKKIERKLTRAQPTRNLWGEIIHKKTKDPVDSCEIRIKGTMEVVYSNAKGGFMITVPNNKTIQLEINKGGLSQLVTYDVDTDFKRMKLKYK
ncbi:hypothetical protein RT717_15765 [Imperialibacter roseus]|uniref:Carboxypeptidase-like regulatory domain-containing protein n=1 Tax=Imperialibacter roseus TaxID=1324217 RepID=A0ABZ0IJ85_9BACT|nr:carboxypeptidase-like regulatory domain-containing protein [Imperialibacter roseus]WOK04538.1 hypothetical protein RT717_15765 [Imperialibacter roseus]